MARERVLPVPPNASKLPTMVGAVIYVRVSTKEQTENLSLPTQLRACEEYCRRQGYEIFERFHEEGESAKTTDRSQLQNLLTFCRLNKGRVHFVVVFNLTRFARDKYDHFALRSLLQSLGISLRSATEPIDDTSTGQVDGGRACGIRAVRQRLSLRPDPRRHEGRAGARALGVPGTARLSECAAGDWQEPDARSRTRAACAPRIRGVRNRPFHQATSARAGARLGPHEPPGSSADVPSDRDAAAESPLRRHRGRARVRRPREAWRLRAADFR